MREKRILGTALSCSLTHSLSLSLSHTRLKCYAPQCSHTHAHVSAGGAGNNVPRRQQQVSMFPAPLGARTPVCTFRQAEPAVNVSRLRSVGLHAASRSGGPLPPLPASPGPSVPGPTFPAPLGPARPAGVRQGGAAERRPRPRPHVPRSPPHGPRPPQPRLADVRKTGAGRAADSAGRRQRSPPTTVTAHAHMCARAGRLSLPSTFPAPIGSARPAGVRQAEANER